MNTLEITINGEMFRHKIYHFVLTYSAVAKELEQAQKAALPEHFEIPAPSLDEYDNVPHGGTDA